MLPGVSIPPQQRSSPTSSILIIRALKTLTAELEAAARSLGLQILTLYASTEADLHFAFEKAAALRTGALVIGTDPFFLSRAGSTR
jgi:hypothetical protein